MDEWVIIHSGTKGMRHGVRRYQNPDGTWTELGKARRRDAYGDVGRDNMHGATPVRSGRQKRGVSLTLRDRIRAKRNLKRERALEKERQKKSADEEEQRRLEEDEKQRIINSGDAELLEKNKSRLSDDEINAALRRIDLFKRASAASESQRLSKKGEGLVSKAVNTGEKLVKLLNVTVNLRDAFNKLNGDDGDKERKLYGSLDELYKHRTEMSAKDFNEMYKAMTSADALGKKVKPGKDKKDDKGQDKDQDKGQDKDQDKGQDKGQKGKRDKKGDKDPDSSSSSQSENDDRRWGSFIKKTDGSGKVKSGSTPKGKFRNPDGDNSEAKSGSYQLSTSERDEWRRTGSLGPSARYYIRSNSGPEQQRVWRDSHGKIRRGYGTGKRTRKSGNSNEKY